VVPRSFTAAEPRGNGIGGALDEAAVVFATTLEIAPSIVAAIVGTTAAEIPRAWNALAIASEARLAAAIAKATISPALVAPEVAAAPPPGFGTVPVA
jgi:hypothetical protein